MSGVLRKDQLEKSLHDEKKLIEEGVLKEDNPLDVSESFRILCEACRRGDLRVCQEKIQEGVNINAKDQYDYTPLILASLCGHYEMVQLLLESGALCERDTFQGERCLYNALNDRIRNLLLQYDYSKSTDPLQPLAAHITSLLSREHPNTADITVSGINDSFPLHKFVLSARSPYFKTKLSSTPDTATWKLPLTIPPQAFGIVLKHLYLGELPRDLGGGPGTGFTDSEVLAGVDRISKHLEIQSLSQLILDSSDRRLARQRRQDEVEKGRDQLESWFRNNVLKHAVQTDTSKADDIKWDRNNGIFADALLRADEDEEEDGGEDSSSSSQGPPESRPNTNALGIPMDTLSGTPSRSASTSRKPRRSKIYPCHKAMLIRSEVFATMLDSNWREAQETDHLQIIPIDCSPAVLEIILTFLYTEQCNFDLDVAVDVLFAADMLFLEKVKAKAAVVISTLGNGTATSLPTEIARADDEMDIYEILRAAWLTRVQRLEEFAARYIAYRLEQYIDDPAFAELVRESAGRISARQETDSIELLDDIRYYLSERFRLRFEDSGLDDVMDEEAAIAAAVADANAAAAAADTVAATSQHPPNGIATSVSRDLHTPVETNGIKDPSTPPPQSMPEDEAIDMSTPEPQLESQHQPSPQPHQPPHQQIPTSHHPNQDISESLLNPSAVRTLDGEIAGDEFAADAVNYQILLGKIDRLLERLMLDA